MKNANGNNEKLSEAPGQTELRNSLGMEDLVKRNIELTEEVLKLARKLDSYRKWQQFLGILKILIIIIPLVLGIYFLPTILDKALAPYKELLGVTESINNLGSNGLSSELLKKLK